MARDLALAGQFQDLLTVWSAVRQVERELLRYFLGSDGFPDLSMEFFHWGKILWSSRGSSEI